jgi:hypothetical protein
MMKTVTVKHRMSILTGDITVSLDGKLTPVIRWLFTNGQCHALAVALHELLGWRIVVAINGRGEETHFFTVTPEGKYADIHSLHDTISDARGVDCHPEYVLQCYGKYGFCKPNMVFARHFAPLVATELSKIGAV